MTVANNNAHYKGVHEIDEERLTIMIIDINIHPKSFPLRLFLMFKYLSQDVKHGKLGKADFITEWVKVIERIKSRPAYQKIFWDTVHYKLPNMKGDMDSVVDNFIDLK